MPVNVGWKTWEESPFHRPPTLSINGGQCKHDGNSRLVCSATSPSPQQLITEAKTTQQRVVPSGSESHPRHHPPPLPGPAIVASSERRVKPHFSGEEASSSIFSWAPPSEFRALPSKTRCVAIAGVVPTSIGPHTCHSYSASRIKLDFYAVRRRSSASLCTYNFKMTRPVRGFVNRTTTSFVAPTTVLRQPGKKQRCWTFHVTGITWEEGKHHRTVGHRISLAGMLPSRGCTAHPSRT